MMESGPVLCDIPSVKHKRAAPRRPEPQLEGYQYNAPANGGWGAPPPAQTGWGTPPAPAPTGWARRRHRLRLAGAGPRRPRRRRLAGAPRRPKTEYFDPSARGVCEEPSTERPGDGVKLGPLLLQWRPVATKRSLMLTCSVVAQSRLWSSRKAMLQLSLIDHPGHHRRVTSPPIDSL